MDERKHLMAIDDQQGCLLSLQAILEPDYRVTLIDDPEEGVRRAAKESPDLLLLDLVMPKLDGLEVLQKLKQLGNVPPTIMVSGANPLNLNRALELGALAQVRKPYSVSALRQAVAAALEATRNNTFEFDLTQKDPPHGIIGQAQILLETLQKAEAVAKSNSNVMLLGESGTGKEVLAQYVHNLSPRSKKPLCAINCAAISNTLVESELFGHEKGAFTGADKQYEGKLRQAGSGTLFFDEVGDVPLSIQVKLLRVIEERRATAVGSTSSYPVRARFICATHRNLENMVQSGEFREDLYYRLNVIPIHLPALREHPEDIPHLMNHFLRIFSKETQFSTKNMTHAALGALKAYAWPGNVRELRNVIESLVTIYPDVDYWDQTHLPSRIIDAQTSIPVKHPTNKHTSLLDAVAECERQMITEALDRTRGNQSEAARALSISRRILRYKMEKLGLSSSEFGPPANEAPSD